MAKELMPGIYGLLAPFFLSRVLSLMPCLVLSLSSYFVEVMCRRYYQMYLELIVEIAILFLCLCGKLV